MSIRRMNHIVMSKVLPFNFGTNYDSWVRLYANASMRALVGSDPATWTPEVIAEVNKRAKEETELCDRLMALSEEDFYAQVKLLSEKGVP